MSTESIAVPGTPPRRGHLTALRQAGSWLGSRLDGSNVANKKGAERIHRALAVLCFGYALLLSVNAFADGGVPSWGVMAMMMLAAAMYTGRGGRFLRDWAPVLLGLLAYMAAGEFASKISFTVHYMPQLEIDKVIGLGTLPTHWLQEHLYHGTTGPLELFTFLMYLSHFFAPLLLGFFIWWFRRGEGFSALMFGLLAVSLLAEIFYVLAPTAPPWMAGDEGLIEPVHHVIKQALYDLNITAAASLKDEAGTYNVVAAFPSLHAAWPVIGLLVCRRFALPRWVTRLQLLQLVGVWFAIVYAGEHYLSDALAGALLAVVTFKLVMRALESRSSSKAAPAAPAPAVEPEREPEPARDREPEPAWA